ncbi:hypothetical protein ACS0TY_020665 [Phlomoides rotata]
MPTRVMNENGDEIYRGSKKKVMFEDVREEEKEVKEDSCFNNFCCSDESSSIGKNSDLSSEKSGDGEEVQSLYKGPLDAMEALEEVLPIRKGISRFYNGKSKSFASLGDAAASIKEIAKPENAYVRKRRNLVSYNLNWGVMRGNAISKRVTSSSRRTLALAVAIGGRSFSLADLQHSNSISNHES